MFDDFIRIREVFPNKPQKLGARFLTRACVNYESMLKARGTCCCGDTYG